MPELFDRLGGIFRRPPSQPATSQGSTVAAPEAPTAPTESPTVSAPPATEPRTPSAPSAAEPAPAAASASSAGAPTPAATPTEHDQLWAEVDQAWGANDFQKVTAVLDQLRTVDPQENSVIDEKLAAAQFNWAGQVENQGDLPKALYLYQEAKRRNPNLGEADFAIQRVQGKMQPASASGNEPMQQAAAEAPRTYTVQSGDTLSAIAEQFYGSANDWSKIFEANRDQIVNPDMIRPGQTLKIP